jgi:hypothetical protein
VVKDNIIYDYNRVDLHRGKVLGWIKVGCRGFEKMAKKRKILSIFKYFDKFCQDSWQWDHLDAIIL